MECIGRILKVVHSLCQNSWTNLKSLSDKILRGRPCSRKTCQKKKPGSVRSLLGFVRGDEMDHSCGTVRDCEHSVIELAVPYEIRETDDPVNANLLPFSGRELQGFHETLLPPTVGFYVLASWAGTDKFRDQRLMCVKRYFRATRS